MKSNETAEAVLIVLKTIGKWFLIAALVLLALFSIFFAFVKINDYIESRPHVVNEFLKIKLDEKLNDVLFRIEGLELVKEDLKANKEVTKYSNKDSRIAIDIESGRVSGIIYECKNDTDYMVVNNIFCNDPGEKILKKYDDVRILCSKDQIKFRVYDAVNYGVRYYVFSNKIVGFYVSKPSYLETLVGINWSQCE
jgi:uncharacterized membrane protein YqhA